MNREQLEKERNKIISEIISTEFTYVDKLQTIIELLILPLREAGSSILDQNELQFQFLSWELIYGIHKDLYGNMVREQQANRLFNIPEMFYEFSDYLRLYKTYVTNFETAMNRRATLMITNKRYASLIDKVRNDPRCRSGIESLLITPVQRIPRYQILLEQLIKYYDENDSSTMDQYNAIVQSLSKIREAAEENNTAITLQENKRAIMEVMMSIEAKSRINLLDNPNRKLIRSGFLKQLHRNESKTEYMFWLFSDKVIYAEQKSTGSGFVLKVELMLSQCRVDDAHRYRQLESGDNSFVLFSTISTFVLCAK